MMMRCQRICAGALVALTAVGCGAKTEKTVDADTAPKAVPVTVAPLEHRSVERSVEIVGTLKGYEEVTVGSKRMGRVVKVVHDIGDRVRPGEPLIELETIDADLAVEQAEKRVLAELAKLGANPKDKRLMAELAKLRDKQILPRDFDVMTIPSVVQAKVALDRARTNLNRQRSLTNRGAGTAQELQYAENDVDAAVAALDNAVVAAQTTLANALVSKVALDVAQENRNDTVIRAPALSNPPKGHEQLFTYAITKRYVAEGQMLKDGEAVADLVIEDPLRLWADVPERFSTEIKLGQAVRITIASRP
ncbi:MAG: efflux RND transporter periplasmic adaptor subunit, partial [Isosphaeraceae bacterium]